ncbi:MAG TPA: hypothetical protein VNO75_10770, partial [Gemmatimonadaceae bacterium]|nr:hypothetical protein [Gemmatimonadaceae bacterium]
KSATVRAAINFRPRVSVPCVGLNGGASFDWVAARNPVGESERDLLKRVSAKRQGDRRVPRSGASVVPGSARA